MTETVLTQIADGIATVTLNRPEAMNALSKALRHRLYEVMTTLDADDAVRAIVLTGAHSRQGSISRNWAASRERWVPPMRKGQTKIRSRR